MSLYKQYFDDLSNGNAKNYNELIRFSKDFITGNLKMPITHLCGSGNNGKTTLINVLEVLAKENGVKIIKADGNSLNLHNTDILNARYVIINEGNTDDWLNKLSGILKELTGGDKIYHNGKLYSPHINFIITTNKMFDQIDAGLARRIGVIEMNHVFVNNEQNNNIREKLLINKSDFIQFIMDN